ncbi:hypothetical protein N8597_01745 [Akkermansiaceae bacterium]|nr:hypothetical protein [Akkermansiaceae bacterium]MDB4276760.1 hypothetical protein [bacterium]MDA7651280.1 hypothetical protein [Akkermansiaceae bacterium]MDA7675193.1 hypothetical protein [Akkermansiaceae bacterium]MDB4041533.1 hypothetical protein [Akkermansiaceae bacterium]
MNFQTLAATVTALFLLSASVDADVESTFLRADFGDAVSTASGKDGRVIVFPRGWKTREGKDGRLVAVPTEWKTAEGRDGRVVVAPNENPAELLMSDVAPKAVVTFVAKRDKRLANQIALLYWCNRD